MFLTHIDHDDDDDDGGDGFSSGSSVCLTVRMMMRELLGAVALLSLSV